jgi:hypothetical protein
VLASPLRRCQNIPRPSLAMEIDGPIMSMLVALEPHLTRNASVYEPVRKLSEPSTLANRPVVGPLVPVFAWVIVTCGLRAGR